MVPLRRLRDQVRRGAAFLDEHRPGWAEKINLELFEMDDSCHCVLGQQDGDFYAVLDELIVSVPIKGLVPEEDNDKNYRRTRELSKDDERRMRWAIQHGFWSIQLGQYPILEGLWLRQIRLRRFSS